MKKQTFKKHIETRINEVRFTTSEPQEMLGQFLAKNLLRCWKEDFIDEDTGDVVSIDRNEVIANMGNLIEGDLLSRIMFHLQAGDITEVEVSNQKREAGLVRNTHMYPWSVNIEINGKSVKFLLYAAGIEMALDIVKDYVELNYVGSFYIKQAKEYKQCIMINDSLKKLIKDENPGTESVEEPSSPVKNFYQIITNVLTDEYESQYSFVIQAKDVDSAMVLINDWIFNTIRESREKEDNDKPVSFKATVNSAQIIPCNRVIEKDFSLAYSENDI